MTIETLFDWMNERHRIYNKKEKGRPQPWTDDEILGKYKFTNVYRDLDRVSVDLAKRVLSKPWNKDDADLVVGTVCLYRLFNWPDTYALLKHLRHDWDEDEAKEILHEAQADGQQIFTGAYIVTNNGSTRSKIDIVCEAVTEAYRQAPRMVKLIREEQTLENATHVIREYVPCAGPFVAYEIVSDLRWTPLLHKAPDIMTWANPGPGATRGLNRIHNRPLKSKPNARQLLEEMRALLKQSQRPGVLGKHMRPLEMRDIEHSLCEYDKWLRVKNGEGRPRSLYKPYAAA